MLLSGLRFVRAVQRAPWLLLVVVASSAAWAQTDVAGTLPEDYLPGLKGILTAAVKQSPQMLLRQIDLARSEAHVYEEGSQRYPNAGGNVRYDTTQQSTTGSAASRSSGLFYNLGISQSIFRWGEVKNRTAIARIQVAISEKNFAEAYRALAVQLRNVYLDLVVRHATLRQVRYELQLKQEQLASAKLKLDRGSVSPGDVAGLELTLSEMQLALDRREADFDAQRRLLSRLAGMSPDIPEEQIPFEMAVPRYDAALSGRLLAGLLRNGARGTFKAQVDEMNVHNADLSYRIARVRLLPKFTASFNHDLNNWTEVTGGTVAQRALTNDTFEVKGEWTIFDGFATKGAKLSAKAEKRYWEQQRRIDTEAAMDEAQQLERAVGLDARGLQIAEQRRGQAELLVKRATEAIKAGMASPDDLNAATNLLRMAEANTASARAAFLSDWSAFVSRVTDDPALNNIPSRYVRATP